MIPRFLRIQNKSWHSNSYIQAKIKRHLKTPKNKKLNSFSKQCVIDSKRITCIIYKTGIES